MAVLTLATTGRLAVLARAKPELVNHLGALVLSLGLTVGACGNDAIMDASPPGQQLGVIKSSGALMAISVPETAAVGDSVTITVDTVGNGCYRLGDTRVTQVGLRVLITPYDHVADAVCPDILIVMEHKAKVVFTEPGTAMVSIFGVEMPADKVIEIERQVRVTP